MISPIHQLLPHTPLHQTCCQELLWDRRSWWSCPRWPSPGRSRCAATSSTSSASDRSPVCEQNVTFYLEGNNSQEFQKKCIFKFTWGRCSWAAFLRALRLPPSPREVSSRLVAFCEKNEIIKIRQDWMASALMIMFRLEHLCSGNNDQLKPINKKWTLNINLSRTEKVLSQSLQS